MKSTPARILSFLCCLLPALLPLAVRAQSAPAIDCNCLLKLPALHTNACTAYVPDLCLLATNCFSTNVVIGSPGYCSQSPAAGTPVGPGTTYITLTVIDNAGTMAQCVVPFSVTAANCTFTLLCATNKTVECGNTWTFDPPAWTNNCSPPPGTPSNGVVLTVISTTTNGTCPQTITRTWQGVDDCGNSNQCSQTVTVVDTTPPQLNCSCITNSAVYPIILTVQGCAGTIPDLCQPARSCAYDACGVVGCSQSPPAGTSVGVGVFPITVTVYDCASNSASCVVNYTVVPPAGGCAFTLLCSSNKTVQCGSPWTFDTPAYTNACINSAGTNSATVTVLSTVTNGTCPKVITQTWLGWDGCGNSNQCSQTVTVVDTIPPYLDCNCLRNPAVVQLSVVGCSGTIPDLCKLAAACASDNCGVVGCSQSPAAGTVVGPGTYPLTVTVTDCAGNSASCVLNFVVTAPASGCSTNPCPRTLAMTLNTGTTNGSGGLLPTGAPEQVWVNVSAPGGPTPMMVGDPTIWPIVSGPWLPANNTSAWVVPGAYNSGPNGWYTNRVIFNAPCSNICLLGRVASDDDGYFFVNGVLVATSGFTAWTNINDCADFVPGPNTIEFVVHNAGGPTGFRTELEFWSQCCCTSTQTLFSVYSGMGPGGPLPQGAQDPQLALTCAPPGVSITTPVVTQPSPFWMPNGPNSQWVGPFPTLVNAPAGVYCYSLAFNIPCTNTPLQASVTGQWMADDTGTIYLNGAPTGNTLPNGWAFTNWQAISLTSGFVPGLNTLTFYVTNAGTSASPTGFRLELTGSVSCCNPNSNTCSVSITCPTNQSIVTCRAGGDIVTYPLPTASSSCGTITNIVCNPPSGSFFPIGTTVVTCTATDSLGNSATCTFPVTVTQPPPPYVICPPTSLSVTGCMPTMPDLTVLVTVVTNCLTNCSFTITQTIPVGTVLTPGPHVVIVRTCDCQGHCRDCDVVVTAYLSPGCCQPTPVLRLFTGATNGPAGLIPGGNLDPQLLTGPPLFTTSSPYVPSVINWWWLPNSAASQWVGPYPSYATPAAGIYLYTNRFFLCSTNLAKLTGRWTADDTGTIYLNGNPTPNFLPLGWAFTNWHAVNITSQFVPGWNELVFRVTNSLAYSDTGMRAEIVGSACCNNCISLACPSDIVTNTCASGAVVNYNFPIPTAVCGNLASVVCTPPPGSFFPVGTTVVTCTAIDTLGNAATCSFNVIVNQIGKPVLIRCPRNQVIYTCGTSAVAYYSALASGNIGPVVCTPPSGTSFPLGTNVVTCTATNACGAVATCQFLVIVKQSPLGPPLVFQAGLPDNFALPIEPSPQTACMVAAMSGYPLWKGFDDPATRKALGHLFTGLPNNVAQAQLIIRMKPGIDPASANDGLYIGLTSCSFSGWIYSSPISAVAGAVPPTSGTWITPNNGSTTFTLNLSPAIVSYINTAQILDVVVFDNTTVDYMQLRVWPCPPPIVNNGLPHWTGVNGVAPSAIASIPQPDLPDFGPIGRGPAISILPPNGDPAQPSSVEIGLGGGQGFSFTTVLDMNAPDGSQIVISAPTAYGSNAPVLTFVRTCRPRCGWDIKTSKVDDTSDSRVSAVNDDGSLLDSFVATPDQLVSDPPVTLYPDTGITQFPVSVLLDGTTGGITVTFPGAVARRLCGGLPCPRGWDGTIKGRVAGGRKGWDGTVRCPCYDDASRIVFTPTTPYQPGPRGSIAVSSTGLSELILAGEQILTMGGHIVQPDQSTPDSLSSFQGTGAGDGVSWSALNDTSGISVDLGQSASFNVGIHHFETGDIPTEDQLFRIFTNRPGPGPTYPPPPPIELNLLQGPAGVGSFVDFTALGATSVTVQVYSNGVQVAYGSTEGPMITPDDPLILDHWPERLAGSSSDGVLRLTSTQPFDIQGFIGDEVRFVPGLPGGTSPAPFYGELQCLGSAGLDSLVYDLQRVAACAPTALNIAPSPAGSVITWSGIGYRLLGAETLDGPWIDLGVTSPVVLGPNAAQRYFRLVCD